MIKSQEKNVIVLLQPLPVKWAATSAAKISGWHVITVLSRCAVLVLTFKTQSWHPAKSVLVLEAGSVLSIEQRVGGSCDISALKLSDLFHSTA